MAKEKPQVTQQADTTDGGQIQTDPQSVAHHVPLTERLDVIEARLDNIDQRLETLVTKADQLIQSLKQLKETITAINQYRGSH